MKFKIEGETSAHGLIPGDTVVGVKMGVGWLLFAPKKKNMYVGKNGVCKEAPDLKFIKEED